MNSIELRKSIVSKIDLIKDKKILIEIFRFLLINKIKYSRNLNGIFINMNDLNSEVLYNLDFFINSII
jgi:hypothetical protein